MGSRIELDKPLPFVDGQRVAVTVEPIAPARHQGSLAAVLEAISRPPHLSRADVAELERAIEAGKLPVRSGGAFDGSRE